MNTPYRFGRFELHPATRQLLADGGAVTLGARAFDVLVALVERREHLVTKDELLQLAWPGLVVEENNLQVQVSALRKALGPQAIATIPGKGYRFALRLEGDAPLAPERPPDAPERRRDPRPWLVPSQSEGPRLAAVVFTDIVGYSSRMQKDEAGTIALVKADFERMRVLCGKHGGESLNTMGDGLLLCFPSALQAVSCALQIQSEFSARKATTPPEQALEHRIGVHLGDVFHLDTGDVAGDGINIASRLESKAPPGGICLSQTVYDTVKGKLPMRARFAGPESFKNIAEPVLIWQVMPENAPAADATPAPQPHPVRWIAGGVLAIALLAIAGGWYWTRQSVPAATPSASTDARVPDAKSIAVLPFANMSEDKDMAYFADGVHEDLLTQLALLGELKVVSRTSVEEYRKTTKNARQIATELGVASLVEGSVRRAGNRVRVTAQLIDARSDKHLWGNNYDRDLKDIFAIQSELAIEVARALNVSLSPSEQARLARRPTENLAAYELLLRQQELALRTANNLEDHAIQERIALLTRAVELDPKFALAWARLAADHARAHFYDVDRSAERLSLAEKAIERALALAPDDIAVRSEVGIVYYYGHRDYARAAQHFEDLLRVAPNHVNTLVPLSYIRRRQGRWPESSALVEKALAIDPRNVLALASLFYNLAAFRHWDETLSLQRRMIELLPGNLDARVRLYQIEWWKSGSFAAYDAWRATLPAGAEHTSLTIWWMDGGRALLHRDFDAMLRLLDTPPRAWREDPRNAVHDLRALVLLAKGERARALELARSSLREIAFGMQRQPDDLGWLLRALRNRAVLGERKAALDEYKRLRARSEYGTDALDTQSIVDLEPEIYALLGDSEKALQIMTQLSKQPMSSAISAKNWRLHLSFASLWDDPRFLAIVNDPASNAPLPIVNQDPAKIPAAN
jgi:TolB-like protein/class 3 adenylate cyclase